MPELPRLRLSFDFEGCSSSVQLISLSAPRMLVFVGPPAYSQTLFPGEYDLQASSMMGTSCATTRASLVDGVPIDGPFRITNDNVLHLTQTKEFGLITGLAPKAAGAMVGIAPAEGAPSWLRGFATSIDEAGRFQARVAPGSYRLRAIEDYTPVEPGVSVTVKSGATVQVILDPLY